MEAPVWPIPPQNYPPRNRNPHLGSGPPLEPSGSMAHGHARRAGGERGIQPGGQPDHHRRMSEELIRSFTEDPGPGTAGQDAGPCRRPMAAKVADDHIAKCPTLTCALPRPVGESGTVYTAGFHCHLAVRRPNWLDFPPKRNSRLRRVGLRHLRTAFLLIAGRERPCGGGWPYRCRRSAVPRTNFASKVTVIQPPAKASVPRRSCKGSPVQRTQRWKSSGTPTRVRRWKR